MFIDASALVAILGREDGWEAIVQQIDSFDGPRFISPIVRYETILGLARKYSQGDGTKASVVERVVQSRIALAEALTHLDVEEVSVTTQIGEMALDASAAYGKVVGHPAKLNFGDCFAYACAKSLDTHLIYKGRDFTHTDLA